MLYSIDENKDIYYDILDILDECFYLTEEESLIHPQQLPIVTYDGYPTIHYNFIEQFTEEYDCSLDEAVSALCEVNNIEDLTITIPDYEILLNPDIITENVNFVLLPIPEDSLAYQFCESCIDAFAESGDEGWLELLIEDVDKDALNDIMNHSNWTAEEKYNATKSLFDKDQKVQAQEQQKKQESIRKNEEKYNNARQAAEDNLTLFQRGKRMGHRIVNDYKGLGYSLKSAMGEKGIGNKLSAVGSAIGKHKAASAGAALAIGGAGLAVKKYMDYRKRIEWEAKNKPKTWLAKKIASLRSIYQKYLMRARIAKAQGQASIFQKIASTILGIIDFLMKKMQNAVN